MVTVTTLEGVRERALWETYLAIKIIELQAANDGRGAGLLTGVADGVAALRATVMRGGAPLGDLLKDPAARAFVFGTEELTEGLGVGVAPLSRMVNRLKTQAKTDEKSRKVRIRGEQPGEPGKPRKARPAESHEEWIARRQHEAATRLQDALEITAKRKPGRPKKAVQAPAPKAAMTVKRHTKRRGPLTITTVSVEPKKTRDEKHYPGKLTPVKGHKRGCTCFIHRRQREARLRRQGIAVPKETRAKPGAKKK